MLIIAIGLGLLGLMLGSFVNALVWRLHQQFIVNSAELVDRKATNYKLQTTNYSILNGRSMCVNCRHTLAWYDLVPLLSWLSLKGKCRYCQKPISRQYPIVEATAAIVFAGSYIFWPQTVHLTDQWLLLGAWLVAFVGLLALAIYDLRWMLLPSKIIYPTLAVAVAGRVAYLSINHDRLLHALFLWAFSIVVASGVFFVLFMVSDGKWIGYGDVRLGLITGTLLADPQKSLAMLFAASLIASLVSVPSLVGGQRKMSSRMPFGPFLITATAIMVVFGDSLLNWYKGLIL